MSPVRPSAPASGQAPPPFAAWLLARLLPHDRQRDVILGDMLEEFRRRSKPRTPTPPDADAPLA